MIENLSEILEKAKTGWKLVTQDPVLLPFLSPGGDYRFLVKCPEALDEKGWNGGNLIEWSVKGDVVVLRHSDTGAGPTCEVRRPVLEKAIGLLATAHEPSPTESEIPASSRESRGSRRSVASKRAGKRKVVSKQAGTKDKGPRAKAG